MTLRYGYNTNGMAHHRLADALVLLGELGYQGCAITLDQAHLDPFSPGIAVEVERTAALARRLGLGLVVETGARYLLDPRRKHHPTLVSDQPEARARRVDFLARAIAIARDLGAEAVSLWSGILPAGTGAEDGWSRLLDGLALVLERARRAGVPLAFEPEPGMLVDGVAQFRRLAAALPELRLTLDLGHVLLTEREPPAEVVRQSAAALVNVHAEDMKRPVHEHLPFGQGEMDYPPILRALRAIEYRGLINVELSRDSHRAPEMARAALQYLQTAEAQA
jgi:sugar phosphate isomerase/epimerase